MEYEEIYGAEPEDTTMEETAADEYDMIYGGEETADTETLSDIKAETNRLIAEGSLRNAAIFIDFDNAYYSLKEYGVDISSDRYNLCRILSEIYGKDVLRDFRAYADFDKININLTKLQTSRVQIRHVYGNGKIEQYRKNASDIELSLDALETLYTNPEIDTYVFVTCDSDMIPIMSRMKFKGKRVILYYTRENISDRQNITVYADSAYDIKEALEIGPERNNPEYWLESAEKALRDWKNLPINHRKFLSANWAQNEISKACCIKHNLASKVLKLLVKNKIMETREINGKLSYEFVN